MAAPASKTSEQRLVLIARKTVQGEQNEEQQEAVETARREAERTHHR